MRLYNSSVQFPQAQVLPPPTVLPEAYAPGYTCQPYPTASWAARPGRAGRRAAMLRGAPAAARRHRRPAAGLPPAPGANGGSGAANYRCERPLSSVPAAWGRSRQGGQRGAGAKRRPVEFFPRAPGRPLLARLFRSAPPPERAGPASATPVPAAPTCPSARGAPPPRPPAAPRRALAAGASGASVPAAPQPPARRAAPPPPPAGAR